MRFQKIRVVTFQGCLAKTYRTDTCILLTRRSYSLYTLYSCIIQDLLGVSVEDSDLPNSLRYFDDTFTCD